MKNSPIKRRTFLKTTAVAASAVMAAPHIVLGAEKKKLRIALIGIGGRGGNARGLARGEDVTAICDVDLGTLGSVGKDYPNARKYQDYRELYENMDAFDAVAISTPDHHHYSASIRAIKAGKAVFCEKPLTWSVWEAQQLAAAAEKYKVATQMGNQGMAGHGWRLAHAMVENGALGEIKEVHSWTPTHGGWMSDGVGRPEGEDKIPENLDWDIWLGPAPVRPYKNGVYHPRRWRGWSDFGGGGLGDWCCHTMNAFFKILNVGYPTSIECTHSTGYTGESYAKGKTVRWDVPAEGDRPAFPAYWYDGTDKPPRPARMEAGRKLGGSGSLLIGTKGTILVDGGHNNTAFLIPETARKSYGKVEIIAPKSRGHNQEFVMAAKGEIPYNAPLSHFGYGGKLTAFALMGNLAMKLPGKKLMYDAKTLRFTNSEEANKLLKRNPRDGWPDMPVA